MNLVKAILILIIDLLRTVSPEVGCVVVGRSSSRRYFGKEIKTRRKR